MPKAAAKRHRRVQRSASLNFLRILPGSKSIQLSNSSLDCAGYVRPLPQANNLLPRELSVQAVSCRSSDLFQALCEMDGAHTPPAHFATLSVWILYSSAYGPFVARSSLCDR